MEEMAVLLGIERPKAHLTASVVDTKSELKHRIHELKQERDELLAAHDRRKLHDVRRAMHDLKHTIRKIEAKASHG
jgi:hypothetical protein